MRFEGGLAQVTRAQWLKRLAGRRSDRVAFVFSGGGPLEALQVGSLRALLESGVRPDLCVGTSVGAMNATFLAFDPTLKGTHALEDVWRTLKEEDLFPGRFKTSWARMLVRGNRVFENSGLRRLIQTRLAEATFDDAEIPLGVVATELETGAEEVFTSGRVLEPLLASAAMPGVYPPVDIGGRSFIDGGVVNNVPIAPALDLGGKTIYVLDTTAHGRQRRPLVRPMDYLLHAFSLARSQRLLIERAALAKERIRLVIIPAAPLDFFVPFGSLEHTTKLIELGYERTREFLAGPAETLVEKVDGEAAVEAIVQAK